MDFYKLSQQDFHVLEEEINENKDILKQKDSVSEFVSRFSWTPNEHVNLF